MQIVQANNFSTDDRVRAIVRKRTLKVKSHIHQFAEFVYVMEGEIIVKHNAIDEIARAGDIVVIPPFQEHGFHTEKNVKPKHWMILFSDTFIQDIVLHENTCFELKNMVFTPSNELKTFIESRMFETEDKIIEPDFEDKLNLKSLIYAVFSEHFKNNHQVSHSRILPEDQIITSDLVETVIKYMRLNFRKDVSIEDCSKEIGYSVSHISHNLPKHLHCTFLQLRNILRISYARELLRFSRISIHMVGFECGFNSEKTFERVFKQLTGLTPKQFRNGTQKRNDTKTSLQSYKD